MTTQKNLNTDVNLTTQELNSAQAFGEKAKAEVLATMAKTSSDNNNSSSNNFSNKILFNVGGQIYPVFRSTLAHHSETMIARLASKQWGNVGNDNNNFDDDDDDDISTINIKPIDIDRDGVRFRYVLDYMRDGEVNLPITESKDAFLKELEYFCFNMEDLKEDTISVGTIADGHKMIKAVGQNHRSTMEDFDASLLDLEEQIKTKKEEKAAYKAAYVLYQYSTDQEDANESFNVIVKQSDDMKVLHEALGSDNSKDLVNGYLAAYGFVLSSVQWEHKWAVQFNKKVTFVLERSHKKRKAVTEEAS